MNVQTTRFGPVNIEADDILLFRDGLIGFESCQHWVVLADGDNSSVAWLQSIHNPELGLPVVSPRRFVSDYQVRIESTRLEDLQLKSLKEAHVLSVVSVDNEGPSLNLRAPILVNINRRLGCQVITHDDQPLRYPLSINSGLKRSA